MPADRIPDPPDVPVKPDDEPAGWLERPANTNVLFYLLCGLGVLLLAADVLLHKHGKFAIEHAFGFYGFGSFAVLVVLVLAARVLRFFVIRSEDYYDR